MRKKRGYIRETPQHLVRDYRLFAIACEGEKREPMYFSMFQNMSPRITVDIIGEIVSIEEMNEHHQQRSSPEWVLDRAIKYVEKEGLADDDELWFIMDIDKWSVEQIRAIATYCDEKTNWHIALSNPCFEVWLYFHKKSDISLSVSTTCNEFKNEISKFDSGGYNAIRWIKNLFTAIENARNADSDPGHFIPNLRETKVYQLCETLINLVGRNSFNEFIDKRLIELEKFEKEKIKLKKSGK